MPLFRSLSRRLSGRASKGVPRSSDSGDLDHLATWASSRRGVEAFVEPRTAVTETTVMLVAATGEWTRRRVDGPAGAAELGRRLGIPVYDVAVVGYPRRMREW